MALCFYQQKIKPLFLPAEHKTGLVVASKHDDPCWTLVAKEIKGSVLQRKVLKILLKSKKKKKK